MIYIYIGGNGTAHSKVIRKPDNDQKGSEQTKQIQIQIQIQIKTKRRGRKRTQGRFFRGVRRVYIRPCLAQCLDDLHSGDGRGRDCNYIGEVVALFLSALSLYVCPEPV